MYKANLLDTIKQLGIKIRQADTDEKIKLQEEMESLIEAYLKDNPFDTEMLIRLALAVYRVPLADNLKAIECLQKVIRLDPENSKALLALTYITLYTIGSVDEDTYKKLCLFKTTDHALLSMIEYAKTLYYFPKAFYQNDQNSWLLYEESLKKSITYCPNYSNNYFELGDYFIGQGKKEEGKNLIKQGIKNIQHIYKTPRKDDFYDITDIDRFLHEHIDGTYITETNLERIKKSLDN